MMTRHHQAWRLRIDRKITYLVVGVIDHGGLPLAPVAGVVHQGSLPGAATRRSFTGRVLDLGGLPLPIHVFVPDRRRREGKSSAGGWGGALS